MELAQLFGAVRAAHVLELMVNRASFDNFDARFADLERETGDLQAALLGMAEVTAVSSPLK